MPRRLLLLCGLLLPALASAGEPAEEAAAHFESGRAAFELGEYDIAVGEFRAAYKLKPLPDVLINIATCLEREYNSSEARAAYEEFLREAPSGSPLRPLADKRLKVLRQLPGSILVTANRPGAEVVLTGENLRQRGTSPQRFDALPPGAYHVRVALADHVPVEADIKLEPGQAHVADVRLEHQVETLTIFSVPDRARVFIDDREYGITPFSRPLDTGRGRKLRLEVPDLPPYGERFDLEAGKPLSRPITFKRPPRSGRVELVLASMLYGGAAAGALTLAIVSNYKFSVTGIGLAVLAPTTAAGIGLGFLASWMLTDDYTKVGHSSIIIGGTAWGTLLGASLSLGLDLSLRNTLAVSLAGGGLGLGAGILTAWRTDLSAGQAAIVNSGGTWGAVTGALVTEAIAFSPSSHDPALGWLTLGGTSLGLLTASLLARRFEISRGHMAIIDMFGALGLGLGYGIGYTTGPRAVSGSLMCTNGSCEGGARWALGGMAIGLVASALLTRHYKGDVVLKEALLRPRGVALELPEMRFAVGASPEGVDRRFTLDFLRGSF